MRRKLKLLLLHVEKSIDVVTVTYTPLPTLLSKQDDARLENLVLSSTINNGWSFRWVENPSKNIKNTLIDIVQKDSFGVAVYFDGWKNAKKQEILGSVLVTSEGQVLVWGGEDLQENVWYQNGGMYFLAPTLLIIKVSNKFNCQRDFKEFPNLVIAIEKAIRIIAYLNKSVTLWLDYTIDKKLNIINILRYFFHVLLVGILIIIAILFYYEQISFKGAYF
ncbi:uncharacterized protein OCT59_013380 [Rhizophagus irregularis]|uniref:uncharacterized protein n=1 Tax=Rhizophagus irregularis TaxID=588596 RepID=UPI0033260070|nr:hypothetical protein OCT59_013380 [Rhizophagus irregularis]